MSRELNPANVEDREYLDGLPGRRQVAGDEEWFGVWLRVQNDDDEPQPAAGEFKIVDTSGTEYEPFELAGDERRSPTGRARSRPTASRCCRPESGAGGGPNQGSMLLFKLNTVGLLEPAARARDQRPRAAASRRPSCSTSRSQLAPRQRRRRWSPAISTSRTAGAATSPPAPASDEQRADGDARPLRRRVADEPGVRLRRAAERSWASSSGGSGRRAGTVLCQLGGAGLAGDRDARDRGAQRRCRAVDDRAHHPSDLPRDARIA